MQNHDLEKRIFSIQSEADFNTVALDVFNFQYMNCEMYSKFIDALKIDIHLVTDYKHIPFLPISFFKTHKIVTDTVINSVVFESSKTTGQVSSKHYVNNIDLYEKSFYKGFVKQFGNPEDYIILALLPSYLERDNSSLVYMATDLIRFSAHKESGFFLHDFEKLHQTIQNNLDKKILLLGVSFALLDFAEKYTVTHPNIIVMETGGMKGKRKEMTRIEIHEILQKSFNIPTIFSEYGMTELLSQAYSKGKGLFETPPWMKVRIRDMYDPFTYLENGKIGGVNVIDLANIYSCSFIETQDVGKLYEHGFFTIEGRFDSSDVRGCNLMYT